jgi:predicted nucleic acid-binding protein
MQRGDARILAVIQRSQAVAVPVVVLGELHSGFRLGNRRAANEELLARFLSKASVRILNVTEEAAVRYAEIDVFLRKKGRPIPRNDVWIAALALEHGLRLLTLDVHFEEIPLLLRELR